MSSCYDMKKIHATFINWLIHIHTHTHAHKATFINHSSLMIWCVFPFNGNEAVTCHINLSDIPDLWAPCVLSKFCSFYVLLVRLKIINYTLCFNVQPLKFHSHSLFLFYAEQLSGFSCHVCLTLVFPLSISISLVLLTYSASLLVFHLAHCSPAVSLFCPFFSILISLCISLFLSSSVCACCMTQGRVQHLSVCVCVI